MRIHFKCPFSCQFFAISRNRGGRFDWHWLSFPTFVGTWVVGEGGIEVLWGWPIQIAGKWLNLHLQLPQIDCFLRNSVLCRRNSVWPLLDLVRLGKSCGGASVRWLFLAYTTLLHCFNSSKQSCGQGTLGDVWAIMQLTRLHRMGGLLILFLYEPE